MRTWGEIAGLVSQTVRLWVRFLPQLVTWYCLGYAVNLAGRYGSALLGGEHRVWATLSVGVSVIALAVATLLMIKTLAPGLPAYQRILRQSADSRSAQTPVVQTSATMAPEVVAAVEEELDLAARRGRLQTVAAVVGPVLAIYSVWNLVQDEVRSVFILNLAIRGVGGAQGFSVNFSQSTFYFVAAAAVWVARTALGRVTRVVGRRAGPATGSGARRLLAGLTPLYILLEGLWVFLLFIALFIVGSDAQSWWSQRALQGWLSDAWVAVTGLLPTIVVPLPELVRSAASWFFTTLLPQTFQVVGLPLVFLAVTATVFGWQERRLSSAAGARLAASRRLTRLREEAQRSSVVPTGRGTRTVVELLTDDLRTRYVPLLNSLGMLVGRGLRFVGAFLVVASVAGLVQSLVELVTFRLLGPASGYVLVAHDSLVTLVSGVLLQPVLVCLYGAAFDRALDSLDLVAVPIGTPPPAPAQEADDPWHAAARAYAAGPGLRAAPPARA